MRGERVALGMIELRSEVAGLRVLDTVTKHVHLDSVWGQTVCPGKFLVFLVGQAAEVRTALKAGQEVAASQSVPVEFSALHPDVWPALTGSTVADIGGQQDRTSSSFPSSSLLALETYTATAAVSAADVTAKTGGVKLLRIRLACGLGGKGLVTGMGKVAEISEALTNVRRALGAVIADARVVAAPHPRLWEIVL